MTAGFWTPSPDSVAALRGLRGVFRESLRRRRQALQESVENRHDHGHVQPASADVIRSHEDGGGVKHVEDPIHQAEHHGVDVILADVLGQLLLEDFLKLLLQAVLEVEGCHRGDVARGLADHGPARASSSFPSSSRGSAEICNERKEAQNGERQQEVVGARYAH